MRSFLFVPGDSLKKIAKALASGADALILDLEDGVAFDAKRVARETVLQTLNEPRRAKRLFVRINAFESEMSEADLDAIMQGQPDGIVLPKCQSADDVLRLSSLLDKFEATLQLDQGSTKIIAIATETADSLFGLGSYKRAGPRLWGLMWGAEDLATSLGAMTNNIDGVYTEPFRLARNLCLMAAAAARVVAIDAICPILDDLAHVEQETQAARRDGFGAKAVIHPNHVDSVNAAFTPKQEEINWASQVIAAFEQNPALGTVRINGRMIDRPHLRLAHRILLLAGMKPISQDTNVCSK